MSESENKNQPFSRLPLEELINVPLQEAAEAQRLLAKAMAEFIQHIVLKDDGDNVLIDKSSK